MDKDILLDLIDEYSEARALVAATERVEHSEAFMVMATRDRDASFRLLTEYIDKHFVK